MAVTLFPDASPAKVAAVLRALAHDMGDPYLMDDDLLAGMLTDTGGATGAVLAEDSAGPVGVALYSIFVSTTRGRVGAFVTDLWVAEGQRGTGLGRALLACARDTVAARWGATFLRLNYDADNQGAAAFYARLGFQAMPQETWVTLEGTGLQELA